MEFTLFFPKTNYSLSHMETACLIFHAEFSRATFWTKIQDKYHYFNGVIVCWIDSGGQMVRYMAKW